MTVHPSSFLAANILPAKLLRCRAVIQDGRIVPYHLQFTITNACNADCPWCCCARVDRRVEMTTAEAKAVLSAFAALGTRAVSFTGGGEPTVHAGFGEILAHTTALGLAAGLATNGLRWDEEGSVPSIFARTLTWCRVSVDNLVARDRLSELCHIAEAMPGVDMAASLVLTTDTEQSTISSVCELLNCIPNLTHVRLCCDVRAPSLSVATRARAIAAPFGSRVIVQDRTISEAGTNPCLVSRLRPWVAASGMVYPCCGVQYARQLDLCMPEAFSMGHWSTYGEAAPFDGRACTRCFYASYNAVLAALTEPIAHGLFL